MKHTRLYAALLVLGLLTGCGSGESGDEDSAGTPAASPSASPSESPSDEPTLSQEDLQAKIMTNAPPKDLVWNFPDAPGHWQVVPTQQGAQQWQIGQEPCTLILDQPHGVGEAEEPNSQQVLEREVGRLGDSLQATGEPTTVADDPVMVPNQVVGLDGTTATRFAHAHVDYGNGAQADVRALRSGDFALIAMAACGQDRFADVFDKEIAPFLDKLAARTTY